MTKKTDKKKGGVVAPADEFSGPTLPPPSPPPPTPPTPTEG